MSATNIATYIVIAFITVGVLIYLSRRKKNGPNLKIVSHFSKPNPVSRIFGWIFNAHPKSTLEQLESERQREESRAIELRKILEAKRKLAQSVSATAQLQKEIADTNNVIAETRGQKPAKKVKETADTSPLPRVGRVVRR